VTQAPMTAFAQAALDVSVIVAAKFQRTRFGGAVPRSVKVQPPGMASTGGGKQARESVVLAPDDGDSSQSLTVGFIDIGLRAAELRTYGVVEQLFKERFGSACDIPRSQYDAFTKEFEAFLSGEGFIIKIVDVEDRARKDNRADAVAPASSSGSMPWVIGGVLVAIAVLVLGYLAIR
jgi:hypothetical protein